MDRRSSAITPRDLEYMLCDETADPKALPLSLLKEITYGFSPEQEIGRGGFAVVYKGNLENRTVAVKRMSNTYMYEKEFHREVECLMMVKHKNVVRFLGYCVDTQGSMQKYDGEFVMADVQQRLLCFEYLPKGSLHEYITDTSIGLQWRDRYRIIKGVCQGLHYLHQNNIVHLDLKPTNILLDDNLVAKIADFGLSRRFSEIQSRVITVNIGGTLGYLAPEFANGEITYQFDIYSLGVIIIEILTGKKGYHAVDNVVGSWSNVMEKSQRDVQIEQVRVCAEIGIECTNFNPAKRPDMQYVINRFAERDTMDGYIDTNVITSQQAEHDPKKLHRDMPNTPGGASSEDNTTAVTVAETNPYNKFWENTAKPDMLNEKMDALWCRYQQLNPDIRRCLGYCSIFPRKAVLHMDKLVALWMAQGFVKTSCATKDMEDTAEGYIQELVSYSFLQPEPRYGKGWCVYGKGRCVTIPDMLHDLLDKVAGNCLRIENARNQIGEAWEGYVPQDVQHLLIQNYDAELITEKILGLQNLLTLIVYVVKDAPVEERVIESICKRLPKLRVLAVAFSDNAYWDGILEPKQLPVPESISELHHLCYLAFRIREHGIVSLPSTINKLQHIQFLDFGEGDTGEFSFGDHVNLRYLIRGLPSAYVDVLRSLQMLRPMVVMNQQGNNGIKQLRDLNKLCGWLYINGLQELKSKDEALEVNLAAKERLTKLRLEWSLGCSVSLPWGIRKVQADVLEGLCPPAGLQTLKIFNYEASRYPDWMMAKVNGGPKGLQKLELQSWTQLGPAPQLVEAFPHLRKLTIWYCTWHTLPSNMEHLTSLGKLDIYYCKNIRSLPTLPQSLEDFTLDGCNDEFMKSCQTIGHPNWQKIEHVCVKSFL